jgi:hypothetical protein
MGIYCAYFVCIKYMLFYHFYFIIVLHEGDGEGGMESFLLNCKIG